MPARTVGRVQSRAAFRELQRSRSRARCGPVRATFAPVDAAANGIFPQVGYAISKACGSAVVRNSLRRRMREAARATAGTLPKGFYLLRLEPAAAGCARGEFSALVQKALQRAGESGQARS